MNRRVDVVESENDDDDDEEAESSAVDDSPAHESELFQEIKAVDQRRCCSCLLIFPNESSLLEHAEQVHKVDDPPKEDAVNNKLCNVCYKLINKTNYVRHGRLPKTLFRCTACDDLFFSKKHVLKHYRWDHYRPRKCCTCKQTFKTVEALRQHSNEVHLPNKRKPDKNRPYGCNLCYKTFKNKGSRDNHRSRAFNYFSCSKCRKNFSLLRLLRLHEETHADPTVNVCPYCAKAFDDRIKCERHVRDVHEQSRHQCEPCGKAYKCRKTLIRHNIVEHGIPGPYACDRCPVSFALAGEVKDHRRKFHPDGVGSSEEQAMEMEEEGEASWECKLEVEEPKLVGFEDSEEEEEEEDDGAKHELSYIPGRQRERPSHLEIALTIPKRSTLELSIDFDYIFLKWQEYPPDASHGHYLQPSIISVLLPTARNYTSLPREAALFRDSFNATQPEGYFLQLRTEALLLTLPIPDFSMPYNVICLACTVVALAFGPIHNISTKKIVAKSKEPKDKPKWGQKIRGWFGKGKKKVEDGGEGSGDKTELVEGEK
ncbi:conserved hypothetical protein [Culex quinquefasciatus]|uniref:C2H2-type domain-containing protein n=1 Tax=Culex quinquefasciatus TaxID=7176 RepID=B0XEJ1_CULQU|nr:conserved hypothetical protein [Culex quinquefasciatus]|eukprot:XP_001868063.1 conserved hypothetical protein [Culex quinquefasciatus]